MGPDQLRALAEALAKGTHFVDSPELHAAMQNAADYLRACADEKPVEGAVYEDGGVSLIRRGTERERCNRRGVQLLYLHPAPAAPQAEPRLRECAQRLVTSAEWGLAGALNASSKSRDIPSSARSVVKARHLAALRDALSGE